MKHIDGLSFRNLANQYGISTSTSYRKVLKALRQLPNCADVTRVHCSKFNGILLADGKFVRVKGYRDKIPVIYGIDYKTHDIPTYKLTRSEGYINWLKYFESLRLLNYPLQVLVSDDNPNIRDPCSKVYPKMIFQLCQKHYKDNVRRSLSITENQTHLRFYLEIIDLFKVKRSEDDFNRAAKNIMRKYLDKELLTSTMVDIDRRKPELLGYLKSKESIPTTNNLIECFNSHIQGRLKTIKGFESFRHANMWFNAYFVRRRLKPFTSCTYKFRYLNGKSSISMSSTSRENTPNIFG